MHSATLLIPKVKNLEYVSQYRPICLSNVLFRVFSKVLANRLKQIMPQLVSDQQSAFMADRLISDNIMVAFETLHYMRNHSSGSTGYMALKLDMSKAYGRVEWAYMEKLMRKMGNLKGTLPQLKALDKATLSVLIYFYYAQRVFMGC